MITKEGTIKELKRIAKEYLNIIWTKRTEMELDISLDSDVEAELIKIAIKEFANDN